MKELKFPEGFYWGAATSAFQVEGGIENTDWAKAVRDGRVPEVGIAANHYDRYEEDFDIARELGHNAHRFSIEWARVEPEEGRFDEKEIKHYRDVILALKKRGLKPYTTLWHFSLPLWFSESGGFERSDAPEIFARYAGYIALKLGDVLEGISTMNEPIVFTSNGYLRGTWPPFKRFALTDLVAITNSGKSYEPNPERGLRPLIAYFRVQNTLARAHNAAYDAIKEEYPDMEVSIVKHIILFHSNGNPFNKLLAHFSNWQWTHRFMRRVCEKCDSIGLNFYIHKKFGDTEVYHKTDMNWDFVPEKICDALKMLTRYRVPLFVSEAGIADHDDDNRAEYITRQVQGVWQAIQDGVDVRGHMYWSLLDNYEWALGYEKRFGLVEIDYKTQKRKIRPSAYVYKKICEENKLVIED